MIYRFEVLANIRDVFQLYKQYRFELKRVEQQRTKEVMSLNELAGRRSCWFLNMGQRSF